MLQFLSISPESITKQRFTFILLDLINSLYNTSIVRKKTKEKPKKILFCL